MPRKSKTDAGEGVSPVDQIQAYLEQNKGDHYNFEEERSYVVSSGSLLMDIEMGGGIGPGVIRASGITEGGKTSCALAFAKNFQKMDNAMVVYFKAEGRLTKEMVKRAGIDQDPLKWREIKSNVYETVINLMEMSVEMSLFSHVWAELLALFSDSSRSSASVPPIFTPKRCLGGELLPKLFLE